MFFILPERKQTLINRFIKKRYDISFFITELETYNEETEVFTKILCGSFDYLVNNKDNEKYIIFKYKKTTNNILEMISINEKRDLWSW